MALRIQGKTLLVASVSRLLALPREAGDGFLDREALRVLQTAVRSPLLWTLLGGVGRDNADAAAVMGRAQVTGKAGSDTDANLPVGWSLHDVRVVLGDNAALWFEELPRNHGTGAGALCASTRHRRHHYGGTEAGVLRDPLLTHNVALYQQGLPAPYAQCVRKTELLEQHDGLEHVLQLAREQALSLPSNVPLDLDVLKLVTWPHTAADCVLELASWARDCADHLQTQRQFPFAAAVHRTHARGTGPTAPATGPAPAPAAAGHRDTDTAALVQQFLLSLQDEESRVAVCASPALVRLVQALLRLAPLLCSQLRMLSANC